MTNSEQVPEIIETPPIPDGAIRHEGTIRRLKPSHGFIECPVLERDYFFHWRDLSKNTKQFRYLKEGEKVTFFPVETGKGLRALQVTIISSS